MRSIVVIAEISPLLLGWLLAICFFLCVAGVAVISRGRAWYEIGCIFLLSYFLTASLVLTGAYFLFDTEVLTLELIEPAPPYQRDK